MSSKYDKFISECWNDHDKKSEDVARRLGGNLRLLESPEQVAQYVSIVTHTFGGHLGQWQQGIELLRQIADKFDEKSVYRGLATLYYCADDQESFTKSLSSIDDADARLSVLSMASTELLASGDTGRALVAFENVLAEVSETTGKVAARTLAVSGNNMACELEEKTDRTEKETTLMLIAATTARKYWEIAGTWENVERAEYRLSQSMLAGGKLDQALIHANECKRICVENDAAPLEHFFAHEALTRIHRAKCVILREKVQPDDQQYCTLP